MTALFLVCLFSLFWMVVAFGGSLFAITADRPRLAVALMLPSIATSLMLWMVFITIAVLTGWEG